MSGTDPTGLATYMCTQSLHALGPLSKPVYAPSSNKLFHQFVAVIRPDGSAVTDGQDKAGESPWSDGKPSKGDGENGNHQCKKVFDDNVCIEKCLMPILTSSQRPKYALIPGTFNGGENCQSWADKTVAECVAQCKGQ